MDLTDFERRVASIAGAFPFPPTPDVRAGVVEKVRREAAKAAVVRRLAWGALALCLAAGLITAVVPAARAALVEFMQLGSVRLRLGPDVQVVGPSGKTAVTWPPDFAGETTLDEARRNFPYEVRLPSPSAGLGAPDLVFAPDDPAASVILIWLSPDGEQPRLALFELAPSAIYEKQSMAIIERTQVAGRSAIWASGPYLAEVQGGGLAERRIIEGHVLIWTDGGLTYRLETGGSIRDAVATAEGLQ
ncbi:MAG: hypothetical protein WBR18_04430 [Anaerolineales bacterium]